MRRNLKLKTKQTRPVLKRVLSSIVLAMMLATMPVSDSANVSDAFSAESVTVSLEELDSVLAEVDSLLLEHRLLQIELWETRSKAQVDSVLFADRLALREDRDTWVVRVLKHPVLDAVYFVLGVYVGANAVQAANN